MSKVLGVDIEMRPDLIFLTARWKLTAGYTAFFAIFIIFFSLLFYVFQVRALSRSHQLPWEVVERVQQRLGRIDAAQHDQLITILEQRYQDITTELRLVLLKTLLLFDFGAIVICIGVSYILAGYTLDPIEKNYQYQQRFLQDASHELRTPLAVMQAELDVALQKATKKQTTIYNSLLEEVRDMSHLVDDILTLARCGMTTEQPDLVEYTPVRELLSQVKKKFSTQAAKKKVEFEVPEYEKNHKMLGTLEQWDRILGPVVDNALKYTPSGGKVMVTVDKKLGRFEVKVTDTGPGISKEHIEHVFERFYRGDQARNSEGTGLGLSIAQEQADALGGSIDVASKAGRGTTVTIQV